MTTRGYARVSTGEQNLTMQIDALRRYGCELNQIFTDEAPGHTPGVSRPGYVALMAALSPGDTIVVWRLDRLYRQLLMTLTLMEYFKSERIELVSVCESIDTRTAGGRLMVQILAGLAEHEREMIGERVRAGVDAAIARGVRFGRPAALSPAQVAAAREMDAGGKSPRVIGAVLGCSRMTASNAVARRRPYDFEV